MASLSDVSPAWCSPAAMLLANGRDGSLIIFVTEFVVVVLCLFEYALFYHEIDVFLCRTLFAVHLLCYEACQHPEGIGIFVLEDHRGRLAQLVDLFVPDVLRTLMPGTDEHFQFLVPCYQCHRHVQRTAVTHLYRLYDGKSRVFVLLHGEDACSLS